MHQLPRRLTLSITVALAALSGAGAALADTAAMPSFATSGAGCDTIALYDPAWASYGDNFGQALTRGKDYFMSGFYQLAGRGNEIYVAYGGAMANKDRQQAKGITPGALVVLDADTLAHKRNIALPFLPHSVALQAGHDRAIVSYTRAGAFSLVDLASGTQRCFRPDTTAGKDTYRNRYVTPGDDGSFYVSYYSGWGEGVRSTVAKFGADARPAPGYTPAVTEQGMALPAFFQDGRVFTGGKGTKTVDGRDGRVQTVLPDHDDWSIYTYGDGPGQSVLAANYRNDGTPNLLLIDPAGRKASALMTGSGGLETAYVAQGAQAFISNFHSGTVTVAELPADGGTLAPERFVNIVLEGMPQGLYARRTDKGTELFVTPKWKGDVVQKITIAASVRGIAGISRPGACSVIRFDMADRSVSKPQACKVLDARASYGHELALAKKTLGKLKADRQEVQTELPAARAALHRGESGKTTEALKAEVARLESELAYIDKTTTAVEQGQQKLQALSAARR
ncbi:hypothetical protein [Uliginosibacterium sp. H1]|uniref:hypothetical protein n=1 Tax=Uliginosibacterium sp. H1 TaxID=3114757 RepID=UPI002E1735F8|nr:hypothetical protein [Uliginosibacterium sp. H1]